MNLFQLIPKFPFYHSKMIVYLQIIPKSLRILSSIPIQRITISIRVPKASAIL